MTPAGVVAFGHEDEFQLPGKGLGGAGRGVGTTGAGDGVGTSGGTGAGVCAGVGVGGRGLPSGSAQLHGPSASDGEAPRGQEL